MNLSSGTAYGQAANSATDGGEMLPPPASSVLPAVDTINNGRDSANPNDRFEILAGSYFDSGPLAVVAAPPLPPPADDILIAHEALPTVIFGLDGNDVLVGGSFDLGVSSSPYNATPYPVRYNNAELYCGDNYLNGGAGDNLIMPRTGDDTVIGGDGNESNGDVASYADANGSITVSLLDAQPQNTGAFGIDKFSAVENLVGSNFADFLTGDAGSNWLFGLSGDDRIRGGPGVDYLVGGPGIDTADYSAGDPTAASVTLAADGTGTASNDGEGGHDTLWEIEKLLFIPDPMIVSAGPAKTVAPGGSVQLTGSVTGGLLLPGTSYQYQWSPAATLNNPNVLQPTATPTATTTYKLTVTDAKGNQASAFVTVTVAAALVVDAGPDQTIAIGQATQLAAAVTGGVTPYTYTWTPADGLDRTDILRPTATPSRDIQYTLTVTDSLGTVASATMKVTVLTSSTATTSSTSNTSGTDTASGTQDQTNTGTDTSTSTSTNTNTTGTSTQDQPCMSPSDQSTTSTPSTSSPLNCGTGASTATVMNLLLLLVLKRRRGL